MPAWVILDELHLTVLVRKDLAEPQVAAIRRLVGGRRFREALTAAAVAMLPAGAATPLVRIRVSV